MSTIKIFKKAFCLFFVILLYSFDVSAELGSTLSIGHGTRSMNVIKVGVQKSWKTTWLDKTPWPLSGYWELGAYHIHAKPWREPSNRQLQAFVLSTVARAQSPKAYSLFYPYIEIGVGLSQLTKREIVGRELSINFQFEDRLGVGARFGQNKAFDIGLRGVHFSNAFIGAKNHGFNLVTLVLGYWF